MKYVDCNFLAILWAQVFELHENSPGNDNMISVNLFIKFIFSH